MFWAYCRVSTTMDEQEVSIEDQEAWAREEATRRGVPIRVFTERASARTTIGRPVFQAMMAELAALAAPARPSHLLVARFDRLSRDMTDSLLVVRQLNALQVRLFTRDSGEVQAKTFADRAVIVARSMAGESENEARSLRMKASMDRRRAEGKALSKKAPYGIQLVDGRDTPADGEASGWVRKAFAWYLAGDGFRVIARRFRDHAPPHRFVTAHGKVRERSETWDNSRIAKMLRQRRYRGLLVPEQTWDQAQVVRAGKPRWRTDRLRDYPLSGLILCPACDRRLYGRAGGGRLARYYCCRLCLTNYNAARVEAALRERCLRFSVTPDELRAWMNEPAEDRVELEREARALEATSSPAAVEAAKQRVWNLALAAAIPAEDLASQLRRIEADATAKRERLVSLRAQIARAEHGGRTVDRALALLRDFWTLYENSPMERRKMLMAEVVRAVGPVYAAKDGATFGRPLCYDSFQ